MLKYCQRNQLHLVALIFVWKTECHYIDDALPLGSAMRLELPLLHSLGGLKFWGGYSRHASRIRQNLVCTCKTKRRFLSVDWLRKGLYGGQ